MYKRQYDTRLFGTGTASTELVQLFDIVTTNKTDFFREPHHFEHLRGTLLPALAEKGHRRFHVLSAGCSTGEEPYSIAITLRDALGPDWDVQVVACDIDTEVLGEAARGVYPEARLGPVPAELKRRHFQRGVGRSEGTWRVRPEVRSLVEFRQANLTAGPWPFTQPFDAIFCRNVVIYFDRPTQRRLFDRFARQLAPEGQLFVGHSESMIGVSDAFTLVGNTVHRLAQPSAEPAKRRLNIGEVYASRSPAHITTVLGSCISACLHDPVARVGGMNDVLLPRSDTMAGAPGRYGVHAMQSLVARVLELGGQRARLEAKICGANNVLSDLDGSVAAENARFVRGFLTEQGIPLVGERLGGTRALEAVFATDTGRLRCREVVT